MRLIRFELAKLFCRRSVLVLLVLFSVINGAKVYGEWSSYSFLADGDGQRSWHMVHWQLYDQYRGAITAEKVDALLAAWRPLAQATADMTASTATDDEGAMTGNLYSDRNLLEKYFVDPMRYSYEYAGRARQVAEKAQQNIEASGDGALYWQRENAAIYDIYAGRAVPDFAYSEMANYYLNYDFSLVLVLLLCLYGIAGTFAGEKECQMDQLLLTAPNGGRRTVLAKLAAASAFLLLITLWFSALDLVCFIVAFGTAEGIALPVYAIPSFAEAPVNLSVFQCAALAAVARAAGVWALGMLWLLVSLPWRGALRPLIANLALTVAFVVAGAAVAGSPFLWAKALIPYSPMVGQVLLGSTEFLNLGGFPVPLWQAACWFALMAGLALTLVMAVASPKNAWHAKRGAQ